MRRIKFHDVGAGDFPGNGMEVRDRFSYRQASRLTMRNARRKRRIERVHVERDVHGALDFHAVERGQMPHLDDLDAEFLRLFALMSSHGPNANLDQALGGALFHDPGKWTGVRKPVALEFIVEIGMGIEVKDGQSGNALAEGAEDRQGNGVVATQADRTQIMVQQFADLVSMAAKG